MKVVAFNGSARRDGNTAILINHVFSELEKEGISTELVQLSGSKIRGCTACGGCGKNLDKHCVIKDDLVNESIDKMIAADGIILGSPVYFADITGEMKSFMDRTGYVGRANKDMYKQKVGAAVVAVRRAGAMHAFDTLNHFFLINQMFIPGSSYWNIGVGREIGEVNKDEEGIKTMKILGQNFAWLLKKIK
jgi:multimeric flavodoxin WrbA